MTFGSSSGTPSNDVALRGPERLDSVICKGEEQLMSGVHLTYTSIWVDVKRFAMVLQSTVQLASPARCARALLSIHTVTCQLPC